MILTQVMCEYAYFLIEASYADKLPGYESGSFWKFIIYILFSTEFSHHTHEIHCMVKLKCDKPVQLYNYIAR